MAEKALVHRMEQALSLIHIWIRLGAEQNPAFLAAYMQPPELLLRRPRADRHNAHQQLHDLQTVLDIFVFRGPDCARFVLLQASGDVYKRQVQQLPRDRHAVGKRHLRL